MSSRAGGAIAASEERALAGVGGQGGGTKMHLYCPSVYRGQDSIARLLQPC
jgi:hypothetical protein